MTRAVVSLQSLKVLLNLELATLDGCEGMEVETITVLPISGSDGCNWEVPSFAGLRLGEPCRSLAEHLVLAMRAQYNVE